MISLEWWMRIVGVFYLVLCAAALARQPIRVEGPEGVLARAARGDATARFVVDTWVTLGLLLGVLGAALLYFSRTPNDARVLVMTIIAVELAWGIPVDVYKIARGYRQPSVLVFVAIHIVIGVTGFLALAKSAG